MKILLRFVLILAVIVVLNSCNASFNSVNRQSVLASTKIANRATISLATYVNPYSYDNLISKKWDESSKNEYRYGFKDDILSSYNTMLSRSMVNVWGVPPKDKNQGYVICSVSGGKIKGKMWGLVPSILTLFNYCFFGGPVGHAHYERYFDFDVYDAMGRRIKSYHIKGTKNRIQGLYANLSSSETAIELSAFKSAISKFQKEYVNDLGFLEPRLRVAMSDYAANHDKQRANERDDVLRSWIYSNELPTESEIEQAVKIAPDDYVGWALMAQTNLSQNKYWEAIQNFDEYIKLNPACEIIHPYYNKAVYSELIKQEKDAFEAVVASIQLYPDFDACKRLYIDILVKEGSYTQALNLVKEEIQNNPNDLEFVELRDNLNENISQVKANKDNIEQERINRTLAATRMMQAASAQTINSLATLTQRNSQVMVNNQTLQQSGVSSSRVKTKKCTLCGGTGYNPARERAPFYNYNEDTTTEKCEICGERSSHWHKKCSACGGSGEVRTL